MSNVIEEDSIYLSSKLALPNLDGARILLTGSSGLIGMNILSLFNYLLTSKRFSFEVDALSTNLSKQVTVFDPKINFKAGDLSTGVKNFDLRKYDYIIHAATYSQPSKFTTQTMETLNLNGPIVIDLSKYLEPNGTFLFLSTSEIYSGSESNINTESDLGKLPIQSPRASYVYGKIFGEVSLLQLSSQFRIRIGRIALSYGAGTKLGDSRVMNQLIHRAITEGKVELADSGIAIRTYCYVRDTIEMLLNVMFWGKSEIYNIGGISTVSIRELGEQISNVIGVPFYLPTSSANFLEAPMQVKLDISKYEREFGDMQFIQFPDGLLRTVEWQKATLFKKP
jgi:UDP-glucuronate decarboxylase